MKKIMLFFGCPYQYYGRKRIGELYFSQLGERIPEDYDVVFYEDFLEMKMAIEDFKPDTVILPDLMAYELGAISFNNAKKELEEFWSKKGGDGKIVLARLGLSGGIMFSAKLEDCASCISSAHSLKKDTVDNWVFEIREYITDVYKPLSKIQV